MRLAMTLLLCAASWAAMAAPWTEDTLIEPQTNGVTWVTPIGIPEPPFGIREVCPAMPSPWDSETPGFYYINKVTGDNTGRTYGTPGAPRQTLPTTPAAGSVIIVEGDYVGGDLFWVGWEGTEEDPIFLRGIDNENRAIFKSDIAWFDSTYLIIEYVKVTDVDGDFSGGQGGVVSFINSCSHCVLRHSEVTGNLAHGTVTANRYEDSVTPAAQPEYIVMWDVHSHHHGDWETELDQDLCGWNSQGHYLWVLDCEFNHNSGDGATGSGGQFFTGRAHHIYFGRNYAHHMKQGGFWHKQGADIVMSQNVVRNITESPSSTGAGIGTQYAPNRISFLFNDIRYVVEGIKIAGDDEPENGTSALILGNLVRDVERGIVLSGLRDIQIIGNTIINCSELGIYTTAAAYKLNIENNIISGVEGYILEMNNSDHGGSTIKNNIFHDGGSPAFMWGGTDAANLAAFQTASGMGQDCLTSDPLFVNGATNPRLQEGSPAIGAGLADASLAVDGYDWFQDQYSINIRKDLAGTAKPQNGTWDMGAFEFGGGASTITTLSIGTLNVGP